jgi:hypothetical protein
VDDIIWCGGTKDPIEIHTHKVEGPNIEPHHDRIKPSLMLKGKLDIYSRP